MLTKEIFGTADFVTCNEIISSFDWKSVLSEQNTIDKNCENFTNTFLRIIGEYVPQKVVTIRPKDKVWFNSDLRREIRKRNRLHKIARKTKSQFDRDKYKKQRNHVNNMKKYAKEQFYLNANSLLDEYACKLCKLCKLLFYQDPNWGM